MLSWDGSEINLKELFIEEGTFEKTVYWLLRQGKEGKEQILGSKCD